MPRFFQRHDAAFHRLQKRPEFSDLVARFFGETRIEDLWHPFFCVSANLNRAELTMHKSGGLTKATLASSRAPESFRRSFTAVNCTSTAAQSTTCRRSDAGLLRQWNHHRRGCFASSRTGRCGGLRLHRQRYAGAAQPVRIVGAKKSFMPSIPLILMRTLEFGGISYRMTREGSADFNVAAGNARVQADRLAFGG